jgi:hypothetical protein
MRECNHHQGFLMLRHLLDLCLREWEDFQDQMGWHMADNSMVEVHLHQLFEDRNNGRSGFEYLRKRSCTIREFVKIHNSQAGFAEALVY